MPLTRKRVRTALRTVLADPSLGFNAQLILKAPDYSITPFAFDFGPDSTNVLESNMDPEAAAASILTGRKLLLYTSLSRNKETGTGRTKGAAFEGAITAHIDIYM